MFRNALLACLLFGFLAPLPTRSEGIAAQAALSPEIERLLDLIAHRALLMPEVARWKWQRNLPIIDTQREEQLLLQAVREAVQANLDPSGAQALVAAQMSVARDIQEAHFERFARTAPAMGGPDLHQDLRSAINATTTAILAALPPVLPLLPERRDRLTEALDARNRPF